MKLSNLRGPHSQANETIALIAASGLKTDPEQEGIKTPEAVENMQVIRLKTDPEQEGIKTAVGAVDCHVYRFEDRP